MHNTRGYGIRRCLLLITALILGLAVGLHVTSTFASPSNQQALPTLTIGVIGPIDGATAQGVALAIERINARGPFTTPDGASYKLAIKTADANTPEDVLTAITTLKQSNAVAIFGPDDDTLAAKGIAALNGAGVPVFSGASSMDFNPSDLVFRTRANDTWQLGALATYLTTDLAKKNIIVFQGDADQEGKVGVFVKALQGQSVSPSATIVPQQGAAATDIAQGIAQKTPEAVVAFGKFQQLADLYKALRDGGYTGVFAAPNVDDRGLIRAIPAAYRAGIYGVTSWAYSWETPDSDAFTHDYVSLFGEAPNGYSAGAYDSAVAVIIAIKQAGLTPSAIHDKLLAFAPSDSIQGTFNPQIGNNELSQNVSVIETGPYGAPIIVARFNAGQRLPLLEVTPTPTPKPTLTPTSTPSVPTITAKGTVNVRTGPGAAYAIIGKLKKGDTAEIIGANADFTWYVISYRQQNGWVSADLVDAGGDLKSLQIIAAPPTPTPPPVTPTPTTQSFADLVLVGTPQLTPAVPQPGQQFTITFVVMNKGGVDAGPFAIATTLEPGDVFTSVNLAGLGAGQQTQVTLTATMNTTTVNTSALVLDLNNQVNEGPEGEANNKPTFSYRIDRPYIAQSTINITTGSQIDLAGGTPDLSWDGTNLTPINGTKFGILAGVQLPQIYWDYLSPDKINSSAAIPRTQLPPGTVIGVYTAEGKRAVLQVVNYNGDTLVLQFNVYNA